MAKIIDQKFIFKFKNGQNYTIDNNGLIATKTNGNKWNCAIIGNKPIPKNSKTRWKICINTINDTL